MSNDFVIFDCDGGSDDAWALLLLLRANQEKRIKLLGITVCGCGNTDLRNAANNMYRILKAHDSTEIPIFLGAEEPIIPEEKIQTNKFHGNDGFGDVLLHDDKPNIDTIVAKKHAVNAIKEICDKHPNEVTLVGVGPLTNIALCLSMFGTSFAEKIKSIFIMGGNHLGVGNYTRAAEFNFYCDPEAAYIVLEKGKCPISILPWEPCTYDKFFIPIEWRLDVLGQETATKNQAIEILNKVEHAQWIPPGYKGWNPCDAMLVAAFLFGSQIVKKDSHWHATVDLKGNHTRGQMVLDHLHDIERYPKNIQIIEVLDAEFFKSVAQWGAGVHDLKFQFFNESEFVNT